MNVRPFFMTLACASMATLALNAADAKKQTNLDLESKAKEKETVEQVGRGDAYLRSLPILSNKTDALFIIDHTALKKTQPMSDLLKKGKETASILFLYKLTNYFAISAKDIKSLALSVDLSSYNPKSLHTTDFVMMVNLARIYSAEDYFAISAKLGSREGEYKGAQPETKKWGKTYGLSLAGENKPLLITLINSGETLLLSNNDSLMKKTISQYRAGNLEKIPNAHLQKFSLMLNPELPFGCVINITPELRQKFITKNAENNGLLPGMNMPTDPMAAHNTSATYSIWEELSQVQTILAFAEFPKDRFVGQAWIDFTTEKGPVQTAQRISRLIKFFDTDKTLPTPQANFIKSLKRLKFSRIKGSPEVLHGVLTGTAQHIHALCHSVEDVPELQAKVDIGKAQNRFKEEDYVIPTADSQDQSLNPFRGGKAGKVNMGFGTSAKKK